MSAAAVILQSFPFWESVQLSDPASDGATVTCKIVNLLAAASSSSVPFVSVSFLS